MDGYGCQIADQYWFGRKHFCQMQLLYCTVRGEHLSIGLPYQCCTVCNEQQMWRPAFWFWGEKIQTFLSEVQQPSLIDFHECLRLNSWELHVGIWSVSTEVDPYRSEQAERHFQKVLKHFLGSLLLSYFHTQFHSQSVLQCSSFELESFPDSALSGSSSLSSGPSCVNKYQTCMSSKSILRYYSHLHQIHYLWFWRFEPDH